MFSFIFFPWKTQSCSGNRRLKWSWRKHIRWTLLHNSLRNKSAKENIERIACYLFCFYFFESGEPSTARCILEIDASQNIHRFDSHHRCCPRCCVHLLRERESGEQKNMFSTKGGGEDCSFGRKHS